MSTDLSVKIKAASVLINLVATSSLFIDHFIHLKLFKAMAEYLTNLIDSHSLHITIIRGIGNAGFSSSNEQINRILAQDILEPLLTKLQNLAIMNWERQENQELVKFLLHALDLYLKRAHPKYLEPMEGSCDLFCDLSSSKLPLDIRNFAHRIAVNYCGFHEHSELMNGDDNFSGDERIEI